MRILRAQQPKPRVIYFQLNLASGACEDYLDLLMQGLNKDAFEAAFICPEGGILDLWASRAAASGIRVARYPPNVRGLKSIMRLRSLFLELKPDIVHFNDPCLTGVIAGRLAKVPVMVMTHHTPELNRRYNFKGSLSEKTAYRHCGLHFIFTSHFDRNTGMDNEGVPPQRAWVIPYGLPPQRFSPIYDKKEVYAEFSIDFECRLIANIARLSPQKGQIHLIEAAAKVIEKFKNVKFFFIGEGELDRLLKDEVRKRNLQDHFFFTGYRSDVPRLLSAMEILVMPSLFEGLCLAVIEASAMGVPVIASQVGGMRYSVLPEKTGLLVPAGDSGVLADAIIWALEHPEEARDMGLRGKKRFGELFTQETMVLNTERLYNDLLKTQKCRK